MSQAAHTSSTPAKLAQHRTCSLPREPQPSVVPPAVPRSKDRPREAAAQQSQEVAAAP